MAEDYAQLMRPLYDRLRSLEANSRGCFDMQCADQEQSPAASAGDTTATDPESLLACLHRQAMDALKAQLLAHIYAQDHVFFENLIIDVLLAMGYGGRRRDLAKRLGRSHDGGIDGAIAQDELGLDIILVQAKRLKPGASVSGSQVRDFVGSLEANQAHKGVFVTTGQFTTQAKAATKVISRRVVLINGNDLTGLMLRHNIGVRTIESYVFKKIDLCYFAPSASPAWAVK
jgi:restriction system protein